MSLSPVSVAVEGERLRRGYAALNRNDIPAMLEGFAPEIEWTEPVESHGGGGTRRGLAAVRAHLEWARKTWAEGSCEPEMMIPARDRMVVFVHVHVRLKQETEWREGDLADVYTFRDGKVIEFRVFAKRKEALEWAGVEGSAAS